MNQTRRLQTIANCLAAPMNPATRKPKMVCRRRQRHIKEVREIAEKLATINLRS